MRCGKYLIHLLLEGGGRSANGPARSGRPDDKLRGSGGGDNLLTACITPQGNSPQPAHLRCDSRCFASALLEQYGGRRPPVPPPPGEGERKRSRGAPLRPSYERPRHVTLRNRHHRTLIRWSMLSYSRQMPVGAFARAASATARTNGKNERKRFGGETPTDATVVRRAETGTAAPPYGRRTSIGVPPRFLLRRPNATAQLQSALPGMGPVSGRYPQTDPSQYSEAPRRPVVVPVGRVPEAARERVASPRRLRAARAKSATISAVWVLRWVSSMLHHVAICSRLFPGIYRK